MLNLGLARPVCLLLVLPGLFLGCCAQSGDGSGSDDEDQQKQWTSYACENGLLTLECPAGHVIRIIRANYGRFSLTLCNPLGITSNMNLRCISITSRRIVATECDGHNRCEFQVTNELFGDPCPGTSKYAEVKHYCEPGPSVPIPEKMQVCAHALDSGIVYDIYWQIPETTQTILHFMLKYSVGDDVHEKEMSVPKENGHYTFTFTPDIGRQNQAHLFAVKAFSLDYGWGDYSEYISPVRCDNLESRMYTTSKPVVSTTTTPTTEAPEEEDVRPMCLAVDKLGIRWPETWSNEVRTVFCPRYLGHGLVHFKCLPSGEWDPEGPNTDDCVDNVPSTTKLPAPTSPTTTTTTTTTTTSTTSTTTRAVPLHNSLITDTLRKLSQLSSKHAASLDLPSLLPRLTRDMSAYLDSIKDRETKKAVANYFKDAMLALSDGLLKDDKAWDSLTVLQQKLTAASLLRAVEVTGLMTADTMDVGTSNITRKLNVVMKVMNIDLLHGRAAMLDGRPLTGPTMTKVNQFTIPPAVLHQAMAYDDVSVPVVFVIMSNMSEWLTPEPNSRSTNSKVIDARPRREPVRRLVNSDIVSASVSKKPLKNLAEPVVFLMEHRQVESVANPQCSFWNRDLSAWSSDGCWVFESNKTHTVCKCDHLTSFAVLMDITGTTLMLPAKARFSLELITYIGCTISILCLTLSWVTFACFKSLDCDRNTIHKHLVFCLMVAQIVLVIGIQQTKPAILCAIIAGILHFFFLASFAWMCLEGVQLYAMLVEVFESERSRVLWYYLFGYGVPTIIVSTSAGIFPHGYGTELHCWLSVERGFIWSFVGPAAGVMLVNVVMLAIAISIMVRHSTVSHTMRQKSVPQKMSVSGSVYSMETTDHTYHRPEIPTGYQCLAGARYSMGGSSLGGVYGVGGGGSHLYASIDHLELLTCEKPSRNEKLTWVKGAVVLVVLLGLTWVFGVLYLDNVYHTLIFSYIFTVLNTLQGLFIFIFHCLLNDKVQKEYRRLVRHSHWLPDCVRVRYGGASSSGSREPSSSGNVMSRFLHSKQQGAGPGESSSNSTKPFLNQDLHRVSSSAPSSSEGASCSQVSTEVTHNTTTHNNNRKSSRSSTFRSNPTDSRSFRASEVNGITADLSEVPDCSIVDSEFVSEYCQQNMTVSTEVKRYSTASDDSGRGGGMEVEVDEETLDHLASLSVESLSSHPTCRLSSCDYGEGDKSDGWADSDNVDGDDVDELAHYMNLISEVRQSLEQDEEYDEDDGLVDGRDVRTAVRRLPETLPLMVNHSGPDRMDSVVYRPQVMAPLRSPLQSPSLTDVSGVEHNEVHSQPGNPFIRLTGRAPGSSVDMKDGVMNSLPNLNQTQGSGPAQCAQSQPTGPSPSVKRHSSDGHVYFSPFRFSASDC